MITDPTCKGIDVRPNDTIIEFDEDGALHLVQVVDLVPLATSILAHVRHVPNDAVAAVHLGYNDTYMIVR